MFILESTYDGAGTIVENTLLMTDAEAGARGEAMVAASGKLTKCGATAIPQYVLNKTTAAGTSVAQEYISVREDQIFLADYTGTAPVVGTKGYQIDATGLLVNGALSTGGQVEIVSVDTTKSKCRVKFIK